MNKLLWLEFNDANYMICKLCYWCAEQNGMVMCSASKFVQGSSNYQKSSSKEYNFSAPPDLVCKSKENFHAQKTASSIPPSKVTQQIPPASVMAKSVQQINEKYRATLTKLHDIAYYIMPHGLPFTQF